MTTVHGHAVPTDMLIDGRWRAGPGSFAVDDPATGDPVATVSAGGADEALQALDAAERAQHAWSAWAPRARAELFHHAHGLLLDEREAIVDVMVVESGKPRAEAAGEFDLSAGFFRWFGEQVAHVDGGFATASHGGYRIVTRLRPVGPSLLITPWNFPLLMSARKAGAALAAGCTTIMKSAQETPLTTALFVDVLHRAGFPPGTVNLLHSTRSAEVSQALLADRRLRKVSFTGSTGVGSILLRGAAEHITNASMELGGDGPFLVLDDADLDLAVREAVLCKFRNAGQACVAANRIIVHDAVLEEFTKRFVAATRSLVVGNGFDAGVDVGPLITRAQRDRVSAVLDKLLAGGAGLLTGGTPVEGPGNFFPPTALAVPREQILLGEELFAPLATITPVASTAEAIEFANTTHYGLASYVFTRDLSRAMAVSERLEFGMVGVNRGVMADPAAPFGGTKASGLGREGGPHGIQEFLEPQYIALTVDEEAALR